MDQQLGIGVGLDDGRRIRGLFDGVDQYRSPVRQRLRCRTLDCHGRLRCEVIRAEKSGQPHSTSGHQCRKETCGFHTIHPVEIIRVPMAGFPRKACAIWPLAMTLR